LRYPRALVEVDDQGECIGEDSEALLDGFLVVVVPMEYGDSRRREIEVLVVYLDVFGHAPPGDPFQEHVVVAFEVVTASVWSITILVV
jgi:hypothetical protein